MLKAVFDVNILISGLFWKGPCRRVIDFAITRRIEAITSPDILVELETVLYEDFPDIPYTRIEEIIRDILSYSRVVAPERFLLKACVILRMQRLLHVP